MKKINLIIVISLSAIAIIILDQSINSSKAQTTSMKKNNYITPSRVDFDAFEGHQPVRDDL